MMPCRGVCGEAAGPGVAFPADLGGLPAWAEGSRRAWAAVEGKPCGTGRLARVREQNAAERRPARGRGDAGRATGAATREGRSPWN